MGNTSIVASPGLSDTTVRPFNILHRHGCTTHSSSFLLGYSPIPLHSFTLHQCQNKDCSLFGLNSAYGYQLRTSPTKGLTKLKGNTSSAFHVAECKSWLSIGYPFQATIIQSKLENWRQLTRLMDLFWTKHTSAQMLHPQPCSADASIHGNIRKKERTLPLTIPLL